jgi:glycosyltransferase involved in cell wall biosynthesis
MKSALLIAYHFPPVKVSSGLQRTLSFARDLADSGWNAEVLTANQRAYEATSEDQIRDIPDHVKVTRAFSLDTAKHLAIKGRYPDSLAIPDRWITWWMGGLFSGLTAIYRSRPSVIWSTYPIATAHLIGLTLHKLTGIPWVADFRDSMTEEGYPSHPTRRKVYLWIERNTVKYCSKAVFTTPGAIAMYQERYPEIPSERWALIANGYNEEIFSEVEMEIAAEVRSPISDQIVLVHSGVVYPSERDPRPLFHAIANLKSEKLVSALNLKVILRATGHDAIFQPMLEQLDIDDIVLLKPGLPYREALKEMLLADGLLLLQASNCNHQIPAKLYEYFRAKRPIFALTDRNGDTAGSLVEAGYKTITPLNDTNMISQDLLKFLDSIRSETSFVAPNKIVARYSRNISATQLAKLFSAIDIK